MNENYQILRDKRHRSSSSLIGNVIETTFSERRLNIRASIPEVEDHFEVAETRCEDLKEQLDLVKAMRKQKKKLKKRSATILGAMQQPPTEQAHHHNQHLNNDDEEREPVGYISVQAKPKKKALPTQTRVRRAPEAMRPKNPSRSYADRKSEQTYTEEYIKMLQSAPQEFKHVLSNEEHVEPRRVRGKRNSRTDPASPPAPIQHHRTDAPAMTERDDTVRRERKHHKRPPLHPVEFRTDFRQNFEPTEQLQEEAAYQRPRQPYKEERPVVELFNKNNTVRPHKINRMNRVERIRSPEMALNNRYDVSERAEAVIEVGATNKNAKQQLLERNSKTSSNMENPQFNNSPNKMASRVRIRRRHNSRGYQLPTVASRMKQLRGMRNPYVISNHTSIPFIATKSISPSHNVGMNLQQVLNGMKMQQPISNIPLTMAHHMGLRHTPTWGPARQVKSSLMGHPQEKSSLETHDINLIKLGRRLLRLPSYKYMSYSRLLNLYREGEGMVPRFLRAMSKPNYFYQNAFNLAARGDSDGGLLPKPMSRQEMKQSLAEYSSIYREYQHLSQQAKTGGSREDERRLEQLSQELAAREQHIRQVVTAYTEVGPPGTSGLRMSASTLGGVECVRSAYRLNTASEI